MKLKFPTSYNVKYPKTNRNYYAETYGKEFEKKLLESSKYYCMYCGKKLRIDSNLGFNIEHSIEKGGYEKDTHAKTKDNDIKFLKHCKYNLSVACYACNQKYKTRMIERIDKVFVSREINCLKRECTEPCKEYLEIKREYLKRNSIILQPQGLSDNEDVNYEIVYDLLKHVFRPLVTNEELEYKKAKISFIKDHIARFQLNREMFSQCLLEICEFIITVVDNFGVDISIGKIINLLKVQRFDNVLGQIFVDFICDTFKNTGDLNDFCKLLIILEYI